MRSLLTLALAALLAGCAAAARVAPPLDPVGRFEYSTLFQGQPVSGELVVTGAPGAYRGHLTSSFTEDLPVSSVTVEGQEMEAVVETPDASLRMRLTFVGDEFTGSWTMGGATGEIAGRRRR